ncbi:DMT family transporter [Cytobacillus sp. Hm23]
MELKTILSIVVTVFFWASAFVGIRASLDDYSPQNLALLRFLVASLIFLVVALFKKIRIPEKSDMLRIFLSGFIGIALYNFALNYGEQRIEAGIASFIVNTVPIFSALFSMYFLREKFFMRQWIGFIISLCGIILIAYRPETNFTIGVSVFILLFAATTQAAMFTLQKTLTKKYTPLECTAYAIWSGTFTLLWFGPGLLDEILVASMSSTVTVIYLGIFPAAIAYLTWAYVLSKLSVSVAATFLYFVPVGATLIGWVWLREIPTLLSIGGGILVITGVIFVNQKRNMISRSEEENKIHAASS